MVGGGGVGVDVLNLSKKCELSGRKGHSTTSVFILNKLILYCEEVRKRESFVVGDDVRS